MASVNNRPPLCFAGQLTPSSIDEKLSMTRYEALQCCISSRREFFDEIVIGAFIMGHSIEILFLQHAAHTPFANMFDVPSGMFEPTDVTMAHGLVKVVKQATDLEVTEATTGRLPMWEYQAYHVIGGLETRKLCCQINFVVKVGHERVRLHPETPSSARWITGRDFKDLPLVEGTKNAVGMVLASAMRWEVEGSIPNFQRRTLGRNN